MATTVVSRPAPPQQNKMKRPPQPTLQTNGIQSSQSSPSPLMSSKRPPSGFKAPPTPVVNGVSTGINGVQPRLSQRRKDSQKPGDSTRTRNGKEADRRSAKRRTEPYVKTQEYILRKYRGHQPSLIINLHPNNFRFEQQNGSFSYNSPMKVVLEHLRKRTVPHEMTEELIGYGVKYFESCLIVQVKDHRSKDASSSSSNSSTDDTNIPSSVHNYSQWVTPSSYVPFPPQKRAEIDGKQSKGAEAQAGLKSRDKDEDKLKEPKIYTIVLFPTPQSVHEEAYIQANTPDSRPGNRKNQSANVPRIPASASTTVPPTPLSAIPSLPSSSGPPPKKQKMSISGAEIQEFESKVIAATAPPLFLDTVDSLREAHELLETLTDPLHRESLPSPKTRKRTVAELAADEAMAAKDQAFMLVMDEKAGSCLTAGKVSTSDEAGTTRFEPRFERFDAIQHIKAQHQEMKHVLMLQKQKQEMDGKRQELANKARAQREAQDRMEKEQKASLAAQQQAQNAEMQRRKEHVLRQQQHQHQLANQKAVTAAQSNGALPNGYGQPQHSSPIVRNGTPHSNASPVIGHTMISHGGGVPMQATSSGQGSSPGRPSSAMQHAHPAAGGIAMVHQRSRQQNPSRTGTPQMNGTPHMANGTPNIPHSTPVLNQGTPTSRMSQGSPPNIVHTPGMPQGVRPNQNINTIPLEQQQLLLQQSASRQAFMAQVHAQQEQQRERQALQQQHRQMQQNGQMTPNGAHMMPMMSAQQVAAQRDAAARQHMQNHVAMNGIHGHPNVPNSASPHGPLHQASPGHLGQQPTGQSRPINQGGQPLTPQQQLMARQHKIYQEQLNALGLQTAQRLGLAHPNMLSPPQKAEIHNIAKQRTNQITTEAKIQQQQKAQHERQQQQMQQNMQMLNQSGRPMAQGAGVPAGMPMNMAGMGGNAAQMGMNGAQSQMTQEQMMQFAQMSHVNGMSGMNGMG